MNRRTRVSRNVVVAGLATGLMSLPVVASAGPQPVEHPASSSGVVTEQAAAAYNTHVRFLNFLRTRRAGATIHVRGQLTTTIGGRSGALANRRVSLFRRAAGHARFHYLGSQLIRDGAKPKFDFRLPIASTTTYKVVFKGTRNFAPSAGSTTVRTFRIITSHVTDGSLLFTGAISPRYAGKTVYLDKRPCASCRWHRVGLHHSSSSSTFRFHLSAPPSGRWYWRARVPHTVGYIESYSATWYTHVIR